MNVKKKKVPTWNLSLTMHKECPDHTASTRDFALSLTTKPLTPEVISETEEAQRTTPWQFRTQPFYILSPQCCLDVMKHTHLIWTLETGPWDPVCFSEALPLQISPWSMVSLRDGPGVHGHLYLTLCTITEFSDFLERKFCRIYACLLPAIFSASNHFYTLPASDPRPNLFIWKTLRLIWCGDAHGLVGRIFWLSIEHCALGCWQLATVVERVAMTGPVSPCSKGRSFFLEDSEHVTEVWSLFRLWGHFWIVL